MTLFKLTVADLIESLRALPPDMEVRNVFSGGIDAVQEDNNPFTFVEGVYLYIDSAGMVPWRNKPALHTRLKLVRATSSDT